MAAGRDDHELVLWCRDRLSSFLKFPVEDELVRYMLSMNNDSDLEEYLVSLLGDDSSRMFLKELIPRWKPSRALAAGDDDLMTPLVRPKQDDLVLFAEKKHKSKGKDKKGRTGAAIQPPPGLSACHGSNLPHTTTAKPHRPTPQPAPIPKPLASQSDRKPTTTTSGASTKAKFVPLMSTEGQSRMSVHVPGRHPCNCLGQKHTLVNNCLECGRIVCSQEGAGPCLHCGALVVTREDEGLFSRNSKKGNKMKEKLLKQFQIQDTHHVISIPTNTSDQLSHAIGHKEKLLEFDKTSVQRTKVIDDESDYFSVNNRWLSDDHRRLLREREERLREEQRGAHKKTRLTLDIAGRRVIEEDEQFELYSEANIMDIINPPDTSSSRENCTYEMSQEGICNPLLPVAPPQYVQGRRKKQPAVAGDQKASAVSVNTAKLSRQSLRIQDEKFLEMTDEGKCLSMHQPWASLLVTGIKLHEGRTWYTPHRGKLWIAATVKQPDHSEISSVEHFYRKRPGGDDIQFPSEYPTKCLLGCVHVADCLDQDTYREKYRDGESESPYVFICQHPQQLFVKFPVSGKHKIWKLPSDIHLAAKRACQPLVVA